MYVHHKHHDFSDILGKCLQAGWLVIHNIRSCSTENKMKKEVIWPCDFQQILFVSKGGVPMYPPSLITNPHEPMGIASICWKEAKSKQPQCSQTLLTMDAAASCQITLTKKMFKRNTCPKVGPNLWSFCTKQPDAPLVHNHTYTTLVPTPSSSYRWLVLCASCHAVRTFAHGSYCLAIHWDENDDLCGAQTLCKITCCIGWQ